ncbi:membrane-spanning 4-domains subfamily A member 4A-like [Heptranchias perlo]|uniref:membrane-spanning 4-domains subfamily A member 4A-like n=1 Tax=Heptranchias perlo TaxID=212740 RepID=UPI0035598B40
METAFDQRGDELSTDTHPQAQGEGGPSATVEPRANGHRGIPRHLQKLLKGEPKVLGVIQVVLGLIQLLISSVLILGTNLICKYIVAIWWTGFLYISVGILSVFMENKLTKCLMSFTLVMNIINVIFAAVSVLNYGFKFYLIAGRTTKDCKGLLDCMNSTTAIVVLLITTSVLQLAIAITSSTYICFGLQCCGSNTNQGDAALHEP